MKQIYPKPKWQQDEKQQAKMCNDTYVRHICGEIALCLAMCVCVTVIRATMATRP